MGNTSAQEVSIEKLEKQIAKGQKVNPNQIEKLTAEWAQEFFAENSKATESITQEKLVNLWQTYDTDQDGYCDTFEIKSLLGAIVISFRGSGRGGKKVSDKYLHLWISRLLLSMDPSRRGLVSQDQMCGWFHKTCLLAQALESWAQDSQPYQDPALALMNIDKLGGEYATKLTLGDGMMDPTAVKRKSKMRMSIISRGTFMMNESDVTRRKSMAELKEVEEVEEEGTLAEDIELGDRVVIRTRDSGCRGGLVKWKGVPSFAEGVFLGIALDDPVGKHNGTFRGETYFECDQGHGVFSRPESVQNCVPIPQKEVEPEQITPQRLKAINQHRLTMDATLQLLWNMIDTARDDRENLQDIFSQQQQTLKKQRIAVEKLARQFKAERVSGLLSV